MKLRQESEVVVVEPRWPKVDSRGGSKEASRGPWQTRRQMTCPELGTLHTLEPSLLVLHCLP